MASSDRFSTRPPPGRSADRRRSSLVRAVVSLAALVAATVAVLTQSPTLGLDLRGGTQVVLEARDSPTVRADAESTDRVLEVVRRRVDAGGVRADAGALR
jgi:SecD/SecF fusion protein